MDLEAASGIVLLMATAIALIWANAPGGESYEEFWGTVIDVEIGPFHIEETFRLLVNDALMTLFFFVVGLEIKRELRLGDLRDKRAAALPALAALGGMVVPAAIFLAFNAGTEAADGWGIPMATDIAFALGVVALLGSRVPPRAKLFLLALAIVDDIGAIVVIAVFYTESISFVWLAVALAGFGVMYVAKHNEIRSMSFYWVLGIAIWFALFESGVHATLAGVALGLLTPTRPFYSRKEFETEAAALLAKEQDEVDGGPGREHVEHDLMRLADVTKESVAPLTRLEESIHPWTSFVVVPLFALANAGVRVVDIDMGEALTSSLTLGVALGLVVGKLVGVTLFAGIAVWLKLGRLPPGTTWRHITGLAALAGIGFTVALFITGLAFRDNQELGDLSRIGIFAGSLVAGLIGYAILRFGGSNDGTDGDRTEPTEAGVVTT
jgi:NhaA family Na+:H+ antiporter